MATIWFYCDESYDSRERKPNAYVVAGFAADEATWESIRVRWDAKNGRVGVQCFHAVDLNAHAGEFSGWTRQRAKRYSTFLLKILTQKKRKLHAVSVGVLAKDYERIINEEGRKRLGHPYILCFKECIALLAEELHSPQNGWPIDVKFSVILEQNKYQQVALEVFNKMRAHATWRAAYRLGDCYFADRRKDTNLQVADLLAYETFRLIHDRHFGLAKVRIPLTKMFPHNGFSGFYYVPDMLERMKNIAEGDTSEPNGCIIIHNPSYTYDAKTSEPL